jgi:hypothetical protein
MLDIVIHGHFYQPPREDPWLELVPAELSAAPDHDWNERITRQCYAPLALDRVLDRDGRITQVINAYAACSFDVGPTLFRWFDRYAPSVRDAIIAADVASVLRLGHGNAIASPYHHVILPLLSYRDKVTEVRWGIGDFRARYDRDPEGMWLPEAAVDDDTLAVLVEEGIAFTILGPAQVESAPPFGRPGVWRGAGGRSLAICVYDGPASHHVAFGNALEDAAAWETALCAGVPAPDGGSRIRAIATDGETFGHHHRGGDVTLAALIDRLGRRDDVRLANFAAVLAASPAVDTVQVTSPSSWSCAHGIERWRTDCGCRFEHDTTQDWRAPLRNALQTVRDRIIETIEQQWPAAAGDFWAARDVAGPDLAGAPQLAPDARQLLEANRHALAMFTSCAWFFDDLGRLEPQIALRHAARALDLLPRADHDRLEAPLRVTLGQAHSNDPAKGSGADIWQRDVLPAARGPMHLAAGLAALRELAPAAIDEVQMPAHRWHVDGDAIVVTHRRTGRSCRWHAEPVTLGVVATRVHLRSAAGGHATVVANHDFPGPVRDALRIIAAPMVFDAALTADDRTLLISGLLDSTTARARALRGAWLLVARDGLDDAGIVVHSVLDLYDLDGEVPDATLCAEAFLDLQVAPPSRLRDALAERFGLEFPAVG